MTDKTPLTSITIPEWDETDQVPPDLKRSFTEAEKMFVLPCTNAADRDSRYNLSNARAGAIASASAEDKTWRLNGDGTWTLIGYDSGVLTSGVVTPVSGRSRISVQYARSLNGWNIVSVEFIYGGDPVNTGGNISDITLGSVSGDWVPESAVREVASMSHGFGWIHMTSAGNIMLRAMNDGGHIETNDLMSGNFRYPSRTARS